MVSLLLCFSRRGFLGRFDRRILFLAPAIVVCIGSLGFGLSHRGFVGFGRCFGILDWRWRAPQPFASGLGSLRQLEVS